MLLCKSSLLSLPFIFLHISDFYRLYYYSTIISHLRLCFAFWWLPLFTVLVYSHIHSKSIKLFHKIYDWFWFNLHKNRLLLLIFIQTHSNQSDILNYFREKNPACIILHCNVTKKSSDWDQVRNQRIYNFPLFYYLHFMLLSGKKRFCFFHNHTA